MKQLIDALKKKTIAGAAFDVFANVEYRPRIPALKTKAAA
jgi:lactate dehydrogenase-like 2-hydroxyacid dehydrogenase